MGAPAPAYAPQAAGSSAGTVLEEGVRLLGEGRFDEAVVVFNRFKEAEPLDARPYFYTGMAFMEGGKLSAAALELTEAVRLAPGKLEYLVLHASVLVRLNQKAQAGETLAPLKQADQVRKLDSAWLRLLADVYRRLEDFESALGVLELMTERMPDDPRVLLNLGEVSAAMGDLSRAVESFQRSIEKAPDNAPAHFQLGRILHQRNETENSRDALLQAVNLDSDNPEYLHLLGIVWLALNEPEKAMNCLKRAEPSAADYPQIYYALGSAYQRTGDRTQAVQYRRRFQDASLARRQREDQAREVDRLIAQGESELDKEQAEEAKKLFALALLKDPGNWAAHGYLAEISLNAGLPEQAYAHLVKMEEIDPESVVGNYLMARYWFYRTELAKARVYAEKVKAFRPAHPVLRNLLGNIYRGLGDSESARREYKAAVRLAPERSDFRDDLRREEAGGPPLR